MMRDPSSGYAVKSRTMELSVHRAQRGMLESQQVLDMPRPHHFLSGRMSPLQHQRTAENLLRSVVPRIDLPEAASDASRATCYWHCTNGTCGKCRRDAGGTGQTRSR